MAFLLKGTVFVPLSEFLEWFDANNGNRIGTMTTLNFDTMSFDDDSSVCVYDTRGRRWEALSFRFWKFVENYTVDMHPAEWQFGIPKVSDDAIEINFCAASPGSIKSICDPEFSQILNEVNNYVAGTFFSRV